jgi:hypothetical protein
METWSEKSLFRSFGSRELNLIITAEDDIFLFEEREPSHDLVVYIGFPAGLKKSQTTVSCWLIFAIRMRH